MSDLEDFLAAAARAARPDRHHPGAALEARAYLAVAVRIIRAVLRECDAAEERWKQAPAGDAATQRLWEAKGAARIRDAMTYDRRNRK